MRWFHAFVVAFMAQMPLIAQNMHLDAPYAALFDQAAIQIPRREVQSMRSLVKEEREHETERCRIERAGLEVRLESARKGLKTLNATSPYGTAVMVSARRSLHSEIAALEQVLREKNRECDHHIPLAFEIRFAKLDVLERWPARREETLDLIENGRARARKHGDVEDIGYRKIAGESDDDDPAGEQGIRQLAAAGLLPPEIRVPSVREYVQSLASTIARHSDFKTPVRVLLVDSPDVNATAVPGGWMLLTTGVLRACEREAELAGIIAQNIAHMAARRSASKRSLISKMFVPALQVATGLLTGGVSNAGAYYGMEYGFQGLGLLTDRMMTARDGKAQKEADQLGIQYAWNAGFDPKGFVFFLDSLAGKRASVAGADRFLITRPSIGERLLEMFTEIQVLPRREDVVIDSDDFRRMKADLLVD
jgi:hypothetical protein